ncbi:MAG: hypothetical protein DMG16_05225 [Acidobacteria bacterium]|nr:MAG: hypothetical protein DMG16_05225 [Acidobacteriota bacterium]
MANTVDIEKVHQSRSIATFCFCAIAARLPFGETMKPVITASALSFATGNVWANDQASMWGYM